MAGGGLGPRLKTSRDRGSNPRKTMPTDRIMTYSIEDDPMFNLPQEAIDAYPDRPVYRGPSIP